MLICIDIGNSNITIGVFEGEILKFTARLATDTRRTSDQYAIEIRDIIEIYGIKLEDITDAAISSVVPTVGSAIEKAINRLFGINPVVLGPGVKTGLNIKIDNPAQLGADLAAGAVGALAKYPTPTIIIDMGTASTISVLGKNGEFLGGVIAAGVKLTMDALATRTAQLPSVSIEAPKKTIGTNTADCIKSGLIMGQSAMLDGLITKIERELGETATVVATGGLAPEVVKHCDHSIAIDDNLLLDGLRIIHSKNV
ncbi:MAG: type III pantothenate kinase [Clostridia bacterium]|nr:type III pantothenate kinase [Clostridia bacterium]